MRRATCRRSLLLGLALGLLSELGCQTDADRERCEDELALAIPRVQEASAALAEQDLEAGCAELNALYVDHEECCALEVEGSCALTRTVADTVDALPGCALE
ncbi:MAG: hypothetical protein H6713_12925 [Myxococcales bacterium]|nr:hypothetical protein [Myxococcales bacterium]MCB9750883.1 hypothetical protein [Myxococcales bacterium]